MMIVRLSCIVLFVSAIASCVCDPVIFEDCGSDYDLLSVDIEGCKWSLPCYLTNGENVSVVLNFTAGFSSTRLNQDVMLTMNNVNQRTTVSPEPCETTGCPISTSSTSNIHSIMAVPSRIALNSRGYLNWRVYNEENRQVLCYSVLIQTQSLFQKYLRQVLEDRMIDDLPGESIVIDDNVQSENDGGIVNTIGSEDLHVAGQKFDKFNMNDYDSSILELFKRTFVKLDEEKNAQNDLNVNEVNVAHLDTQKYNIMDYKAGDAFINMKDIETLMEDVRRAVVNGDAVFESDKIAVKVK